MLCFDVTDLQDRSRTERDSQIISLVLYILRNLLLLKDPPRTSSSLSSSATSLASLQSRLLVSLRSTGLLELFLTCASNADTPEFSEFSAVLLEITYLIVRGVGVRDVARVREKAKSTRNGEGSGMLGDGEDEQLKALLEQEKRQKQMTKRGAPTRHSRFGTTITLKAVCILFALSPLANRNCVRTKSNMYFIVRKLLPPTHHK